MSNAAQLPFAFALAPGRFPLRLAIPLLPPERPCNKLGGQAIGMTQQRDVSYYTLQCIVYMQGTGI